MPTAVTSILTTRIKNEVFFLETVSQIVKLVNGFLWNFALLFLLCGTGIYFTIPYVEGRTDLDSNNVAVACLLSFVDSVYK